MWKGAGTLCSDKTAPFPSSRCSPERPTGLHNYRVERGAERLQPFPLLGVSYCVLLLMRFLFCFFVGCVTRFGLGAPKLSFFFYTQLIRDKKTNQFFLNFISLVLSCSFLTVIGLLRCKCFSGELSRKRFSMVCPGSAVWLPEEGCTQDVVPHLQLREECVNSPPSASASALPPELG